MWSMHMFMGKFIKQNPILRFRNNNSSAKWHRDDMSIIKIDNWFFVNKFLIYEIFLKIPISVKIDRPFSTILLLCRIYVSRIHILPSLMPQSLIAVFNAKNSDNISRTNL